MTGRRNAVEEVVVAEAPVAIDVVAEVPVAIEAAAKASTVVGAQGFTIPRDGSIDELVNSLAAQVEETESYLAGTRKELAADRQRINELATERQSLLLPARVFKERPAQERLLVVDAELKEKGQRASDSETMIAQLEARLAPIRTYLAGAQMEQHRQRVLERARQLFDGGKLDREYAACIARLTTLIGDLLNRDIEIHSLSIGFQAPAGPGVP